MGDSASSQIPPFETVVGKAFVRSGVRSEFRRECKFPRPSVLPALLGHPVSRLDLRRVSPSGPWQRRGGTNQCENLKLVHHDALR
jgi:hypothetical protein